MGTLAAPAFAGSTVSEQEKTNHTGKTLPADTTKVLKDTTEETGKLIHGAAKDTGDVIKGTAKDTKEMLTPKEKETHKDNWDTTNSHD